MKQQAAPVFIDPTTDFGFKRIFGTETNKDLLISFLNELFQGRKVIEDLFYNKNEHVGDTAEVGTVIFDLTCTASNGEQFIIEVQRTPQTNLKQRMLYYGSKLIADQAPKGNRKGWGYTISEVYVIVLLDDFPMPDSNRSTDYLHDICLCNRDSGEVFYEHLGFIYIELVNFTKGEQELTVDLDRWLHVLKNMSKMDKLPTYLRKPIFEKLFAIAAYSKLNKEERDMYNASLKNKWDAESIRQTAILEQEKARARGLEEGRQEGRKEGRKEGLEEGLKEGLEEGLKEGLKEGEHQKALAIALKLKNMDMAVEDIVQATGLSVEEIEELK